MSNLILILSIFTGFLVLIVYALLWALLRSNSRLIETNKQLLIIVAGKETKPEALRALVATNKPPQKVIPGIAGEKKKEKKTTNTNYTLEIGAN